MALKLAGTVAIVSGEPEGVGLAYAFEQLAGPHIYPASMFYALSTTLVLIATLIFASA